MNMGENVISKGNGGHVWCFARYDIGNDPTKLSESIAAAANIQ
jgi:hypothetical protein